MARGTVEHIKIDCSKEESIFKVIFFVMSMHKNQSVLEWQAIRPPIYLHLIFEISSAKN